jgi:hypothetical protein
MMILLFYFLIAAGAGVAAAAIIGFVLTNLVIGRFEKADPPSELHQIASSSPPHPD